MSQSYKWQNLQFIYVEDWMAYGYEKFAYKVFFLIYGFHNKIATMEHRSVFLANLATFLIAQLILYNMQYFWIQRNPMLDLLASTVLIILWHLSCNGIYTVSLDRFSVGQRHRSIGVAFLYVGLSVCLSVCHTIVTKRIKSKITRSSHRSDSPVILVYDKIRFISKIGQNLPKRGEHKIRL